ncbi:hypothetical protein BDF19DRAFT_281143 [Syncephalis fuscata]|nr:hypothetical protein BDF19DRAFT_281143 [Syncephalis fuscata]
MLPASLFGYCFITTRSIIIIDHIIIIIAVFIIITIILLPTHQHFLCCHTDTHMHTHTHTHTHTQNTTLTATFVHALLLLVHFYLFAACPPVRLFFYLLPFLLATVARQRTRLLAFTKFFATPFFSLSFLRSFAVIPLVVLLVSKDK